MMKKPPMDELRKALPGWTIGEELGEGGYKVVYRCNIGDSSEALKVVYISKESADKTIRKENIGRLMREIRLLQSCDTPFLVKLGSLEPFHLSMEGEDYVIYSEELLEGESLRDHIRDGRRPDSKELASVGYCCLMVVQELWTKNTVHRDIKPDNIVALGPSGRPYVLLDLGVAFVIGGTPLTGDPRAIPGTLYYLAPEMFEQDFRDNLDFRADMYSLALTLYEYATGANPFARGKDAIYTTLQRICRVTPPRLLESRPDLPVELCGAIDQLLKKLPALRPNIHSVIRIMEAYR